MKHRSLSFGRTPLLTILALASVGLGACVSVNKSVLMTDLEPVPMPEVQVYYDGDEVPEHSRVAILHAAGSDGWTNPSQMIDKLREEAGKLGANAIVLLGIEEPTAGERFVNALVGGSTDGERTGEAIAILIPPPGVSRSPSS